ncbi:hypothetical protein [Thalassobacillus pellis]|uniref:hypothetical protein n=1 Tax=Thalassobacillus pellis TaxID=748008 RepID=UPI00196143FC|nr:hypothetical protein [Thalassobacillus pellis]MBM7554513.1 hypothetical protein [Thalassobacillus pellis]
MDTTVAASFCLYEYYDSVEPSSPLASSNTEVPPFFTSHGVWDKIVPVGRSSAPHLQTRLYQASSQPVIYAEPQVLLNGIKALWVRANHGNNFPR